MGIYDGYFEIAIESDAVYIVLYPPGPDGKEISVDDILVELNKQKIRHYSVSIIKAELQNLTEQKRICVTKQETDEESSSNSVDKAYTLKISADNMQVLFTLYPVEHDEKINIEEVVNGIKRLGVVVPFNDEKIIEVVNSNIYNEAKVVAEGVQPINGTPNVVKHYFKTKDDLRPELDDDGNVNFHKLNLVSNVLEGDLLGELILGGEPKNGMDLFGNIVKAKLPKPIRIVKGKNTRLSEDKMKLYAEKDGLVKIEGAKIIVNDAYEVPNNVGVSTGDIEFNGTVIIHGNVLSGFKVVAKGDVEIMGAIENATVEAGGSITSHRGIQGGSNCVIKAGENLHAKYIENCTVLCGGEIYSEAILHSKVSAKGDIVVEGKKGMISGGTVRSGTSISAVTLGSHMATVTSIEVGIDPFVWEEYNEIKKSLPKMKKELIKLDQVINLLNKKKEIEGELDEDKQQMYISATRNKIFLANKVNMNEKKFIELGELVETRNDGVVRVKGTMYSGVKVVIGSAIYYVRDAIQYVELVKKGADIQLNSL